MLTNEKGKALLVDLIESARAFRFCGPSDDPDEQTAVTSGYRYLVIQFERIASPLLSSAYASRLNSIEVEINDLYSAYDGRSELDALLPEIEAALDNLDGTHSGLLDSKKRCTIWTKPLGKLEMRISTRLYARANHCPRLNRSIAGSS